MNARDLLPMLQLPRPALAAIALVFAFGFVSEQSYQDEKRAEAMKREYPHRPAPIFSKRCHERGQTTQAVRPDNGRWIVKCTGKPIRS